MQELWANHKKTYHVTSYNWLNELVSFFPLQVHGWQPPLSNEPKEFVVIKPMVSLLCSGSTCCSIIVYYYQLIIIQIKFFLVSDIFVYVGFVLELFRSWVIKHVLQHLVFFAHKHKTFFWSYPLFCFHQAAWFQVCEKFKVKRRMPLRWMMLFQIIISHTNTHTINPSVPSVFKSNQINPYYLATSQQLIDSSKHDLFLGK